MDQKAKDEILDQIENAMLVVVTTIYSSIIGILTGSGAMFISHLSGNAIETSILLGVALGLFFGIIQAMDLTESSIYQELLQDYEIEAKLVEKNQDPETIRVETNEE
jgi:hypothetical protein